jgi:hypothetical protein
MSKNDSDRQQEKTSHPRMPIRTSPYSCVNHVTQFA